MDHQTVLKCRHKVGRGYGMLETAGATAHAQAGGVTYCGRLIGPESRGWLPMRGGGDVTCRQCGRVIERERS